MDRKIKLRQGCLESGNAGPCGNIAGTNHDHQQARARGPSRPVETGTVMSVTGLEIVRLRRDQFAAARQMLTRAFLDYPLMIYANEQLARRRRGVATLYGAIVRDSLRYGEVHVSAGVEGACCWLPPGVACPPSRAKSAPECWGCRWDSVGPAFSV